MNNSNFTLFKLTVTALGPVVHNADISSSVNDTGELVSLISHSPNLERLRLNCVTFSNDTFNHLMRQCTHLKKLDLKSFDICDDTVKTIAERLPRLEVLKLSDATNVTNKGFHFLQNQLTHLKSLSFTYCTINDDALAFTLQGKPNLRKLSLDRCDNVTDKGLESVVQHAPNLSKISLVWCKSITDQGIKSVVDGIKPLSKIHLMTSSNKKVKLVALFKLWKDHPHLDWGSHSKDFTFAKNLFGENAIEGAEALDNEEFEKAEELLGDRYQLAKALYEKINE